MLKVCINGARSPAAHPRLPVQVNDIVAEAVAGIAAGADAVHAHPKAVDPADGGGDASTVRDSLCASDVDRLVSALREACPGVPIGISSGAWAAPAVSERLAAVASWTVLPDFVSVNWHEDGADEVAGALRERGTGVEAGIWHAGGLEAWTRSASRGACLRALIELQPDDEPTGIEGIARRLVDGVAAAEPYLPILLHGEDRTAWPALALAGAWCLDARIGLEDTLDLPDGSPAAGNQELVTAARRIIDRGAGGPPRGRRPR